MKRKMAVWLGLMAAFGMGDAYPCAAADFEGTYDAIVASLAADSYGGAYLKDGILHIKPTSEENRLRFVAAFGEEIVCYDPIAQYSMAELYAAMEDCPDELFDTLAIDFVGVDEERNGLWVGMFGITEEKKEAFRAAVGIDTVLFEERGAESGAQETQETWLPFFKACLQRLTAWIGA